MPRTWRNISPRERRLVVLTALVVMVAAGYVLTMRALDHVAFLDASITSVENDLAYYSGKAALSAAVERQFEEVAADHSSQWTRPEIHDRLRREIMRLAQRNAPPPGAGQPAAPVRGGGLLVDIHELPMGTLDEGTVGYRQYRISFATQPAAINDVVVFLQRLLESPQALRIDGIDLQRRNPRSQAVNASLTVTRTIIDDAPRQPAAEEAPDTAGFVRNGSFETWDPATASFPEWRHEGLSVAVDSRRATHGRQCLAATSQGSGGSLYQQVRVEAGVTYDLLVDVAASGLGTLAIWNDRAGESLDGAVDLAGDGTYYRYHIRFAVPGAAGDTVAVRVPYIVLDEEGDTLCVDNAVLTAAGDNP
jgi:Type II secretion system (T2SS), protein M